MRYELSNDEWATIRPMLPPIYENVAEFNAKTLAFLGRHTG